MLCRAQACVFGAQVGWLKQFLGDPDSTANKLVAWAGVEGVPSRAGPLEAVLRAKCILLLAVTLKRRAVRWALRLLLPCDGTF